jgi:DNA-binding CsgD family transcriptional regulator
VDALLDALALRVTDGFAAAAPALNRALDRFLAMDPGSEDARRLLWTTARPAGGLLAMELSDLSSWQVLTARNVEVAREAGALVPLELGLHHVALVHLHRGELDRAARLVDNDLLPEMTGRLTAGITGMLLAAWRGDETRASDLIRAVTQEGSTRNVGVPVGYAMLAGAVLHNGLGRYQRAGDCARQALQLDVFGVGPLVVPEMAEAAARTGDTALTGVALDWLSERRSLVPTDWAAGMEARGRALLRGGDAAEDDHRESLERLGRAGFGAQVARSHLLYGEWLRRRDRRSDARAQLRTAYGMLTSMGMRGFAERARQELRAAGETVRRAGGEATTTLTPHEARIAGLARDGHTNQEIADRLFLSARTVQYHLRKVFTKLGISSRRELRDALPPAGLPGLSPGSGRSAGPA